MRRLAESSNQRQAAKKTYPRERSVERGGRRRILPEMVSPPAASRAKGAGGAGGAMAYFSPDPPSFVPPAPPLGKLPGGGGSPSSVDARRKFLSEFRGLGPDIANRISTNRGARGGGAGVGPGEKSCPSCHEEVVDRCGCCLKEKLSLVR